MHHEITAEHRNREGSCLLETIAKTDKKDGEESRLFKFSAE